jgi:hypothetical protein
LEPPSSQHLGAQIGLAQRTEMLNQPLFVEGANLVTENDRFNIKSGGPARDECFVQKDASAWFP